MMCIFKSIKGRIPKDHATGTILYGNKHEENPYEKIKKKKKNKRRK